MIRIVASTHLGLHDSLHVAAPSELTGNENTGRVDNSIGQDNLLDLLSESLLHAGAETLKVLGGLLSLGLLLVSLGQLETLLGDTDQRQLLVTEGLELLDGVLVDGVTQEEDWKRE